MNVLDLDKFLGSEFAKEIPPRESDETISEYKFGEREFAWRLVAEFNGKGEVFGYEITKLFQKHNICVKPPKVSIAHFAAKFRKAKNPSQKLACAIDAIESRVIRKGTQRNTLSTIFGNSTEEKKVEPDDEGGLVSSYVFGTDKNSWRLITFGNSDYIYDYCLTNFFCEPWILRKDRGL
ncbi:hypothetical protein L0244_34255 [bacterium]|nr:hypothetical protein [bacterium]